MRKKRYCHYCGNPLIEKKIEGRKRLFCVSCDIPIYENPVPAVCLIVLDKRNRLLLVKRSVEPKKGLWCLPGGFMELGETPEQTALRELQEETGLLGQIGCLLGADSNPSALYDTVTLICYVVRRYSGRLIAGDDASDAAFFHHEELPEIAFESHRKFIRKHYANWELKIDN